MVLQPSFIDEGEYHLAFTQQYLRNLRETAHGLGDQIMRILLVATMTGHHNHMDMKIKKVEVKRIVPEVMHSFCHHNVMYIYLYRQCQISLTLK